MSTDKISDLKAKFGNTFYFDSAIPLYKDMQFYTGVSFPLTQRVTLTLLSV